MTINKPIAFIFIISIIIFTTQSSIYNYTKCTSTQILNTKTLSCQNCASNKQPNKNQPIPTQCLCKKGFYPTDNSLCVQYFTGSSTACTTDKFINAFDNDGSVKTPLTTCTACDTKAYQNINGTGCIPCYTGMTYIALSKKCQCIDPSYTETAYGCFPQSYISGLGLTLTSSTYSAKLKYLVPGCYYFKDPLSCSQLVNLCVYSMLATTPECQFFKKSGLTSYLYSQSTNVFSMAITSKTDQIKLRLVKYLPQGNYVSQKDLKLSDIMRCGLPSNADIAIVVGSNIQINCDFDFNNLVAQMAGSNFKSYLYQMLIQGQNFNWYEVNVYLNGNSQPVKRFFLEDTITSATSVNVMTALKFELTLSTDSLLVTPSLYLTYSKLTLQLGTGITPASAKKQSMSYAIQFTSQLTGFWSVVMPIFIVINILILVHAIVKTYIGYLNRKTPFLFFLNFIDIWSLWMFYFLMITTGYWFIFTKSTTTIYTFISRDSNLYIAFYVVFALMVAFRIISMLIDKADKLKTQIFMINWQKQNMGNSWREIFIINSLAQFCTYRTFSVFWILFVMLFFVTGFKWQEHSREVINTNVDSIEYFHRKNKILLYFLSTSILLVIAIIFKILRRVTVLFWPYPFEDFVDYCSITNISFFFMKKRSPQAYYIHAEIPDKTEVTYKEINQAVKRGLNKNRSITSQINPDGKLKLYIFYVNRDMEDKFAHMLKKQEDHDHQKHTKYAIGSTVSIKPSPENQKDSFRPRKQFIQRRLKPSLQQMIHSQQKGNIKSLFESFFHIPPVDLRGNQGLNANFIYQDDKFDLIKQVFPNGDQFQELHTIIIIYLLWVVVTGSSPIAAFLTYFCDQWILNAWIGSSYRKQLQKMTRVNQGFML